MRTLTFDRHDPNRSRGFTMIELIIVIAIIGILALLAGPNMASWIWRARLTEATRNLERKLNVARKLALANTTRHCVTFTLDPNWANSGPDYLAQVDVAAESAPGSLLWVPVATPTELAGWVNDPTTEMFKGVAMEAGPGTDGIVGTDNCAGLVYNAQGFLDNPLSDFGSDCDGTANVGASCSKITLKQKALNEQRTLWIDRAGGVRVSSGPTAEPTPPT